ncbi:hypothetical protein Q7C36_000700 [Tachysurus vachellii]|uniref:Uncharacterized protein n=1 Tax=Tachysurus vachellii TaxID=175792 RepID=A0AA88P1H9_TACVA|nr:hypothetical protein Q7C36_000700 [Tachysurus vachellii]
MSRYPLINVFNSDCTVQGSFVIAPAFRSASFQSPLEVRGLSLQSHFRSDQKESQNCRRTANTPHPLTCHTTATTCGGKYRSHFRLLFARDAAES